jgi:hypothetical protein
MDSTQRYRNFLNLQPEIPAPNIFARIPHFFPPELFFPSSFA